MQNFISTTPTSDDQSFVSLKVWFQGRMAELDIPGAALGVIHGDLVHSVGLGVTNTRTQDPVTTSTAFRVASLTKILTATGIMSMVDGVDRTLEAPISARYPPFTVADQDATSTATMEHLLSHSGGWADAPWPDGDTSTLSLADVASDNTVAEQLVRPGALFNYSNSSFLLAGHILAELTGTTYEEVISNRILQPLGMESSGFSRADVSDLTLARGHTEGEAGLEPNDSWDIAPAFNPAGGLLSTVDDLLRFVAFHAGIGSPASAPVSDEGRLEMQRPHGPGGSLGPVAADAMGLGWMLTQAGEHQVAMSFGSDSGAAAGMAIVADAQFGVVVLANSDPGLQLAAETVSKALALYFQAPLPTVHRINVSPDERAALVGTYAIPNELSFEVNVRDTEVTITARAGDQIVPPLTGPVTMLTPTVGEFVVGNMPVLIDFIQAPDGSVGWIRSFARLAPRVG